jgi:hypothetical protein
MHIGLLQAVGPLTNSDVVAATLRIKGSGRLVEGFSVVRRTDPRKSLAGAEVSEQVIERAILEHEHNKVVEEQLGHDLSWVARRALWGAAGRLVNRGVAIQSMESRKC